jgi:pimeloyl-ACP methyl ester carboxylesterase
MFHDHLAIKDLSEPASLRLAHAIAYQGISTSLPVSSILTAYSCQGKGAPPIVLLHGFDSSQLEFRFLIPYLAPYRETWTVDLLGFGFTPHPGNVSVNPENMKTALYEFWQAAIAHPMILVGASMGGATAIDFTLTYPEVVEKLVLIDSTGYTNTPEFVKFLVPPLDQIGVGFLRWRKWWAIKLSQWGGANSSWLDLLYCATLHQEREGWEKAVLEFNKSGGYNFLPSRIAEIKQSTLILWGEHDGVLGTKDAGQFKSAIADSRLVWMSYSGHAPHIQQPQETAEQILSFAAVS